MMKCECCERDIGDFIFEGLNNDEVCFQCRCSTVFDEPYMGSGDTDELIAKIENYIKKYKGMKNETH